jgi:hypothetical protein
LAIDFSFLAALFLQAEKLALREQVEGQTALDQINKCRELETEARALASSASPEQREGYLRTANEWANLATELERDYYLLDRA